MNFSEPLKHKKRTLKPDYSQKILIALAERFKIVSEVSKFKKENNLKPLDQKRWNFVIKNRRLIRMPSIKAGGVCLTSFKIKLTVMFN